MTHCYHIEVFLDALNGLKQVSVGSEAGLAVLWPTSGKARWQHPKDTYGVLIWLIRS
jgi:hypothetical protein